MILFRADGNKTIGAGHIMRCLSIADALKDIGLESAFVTADDCMSGLIKSRGYDNIILNTDYRETDGELDTLFKLKEFNEADGIVADSYFATDSYLKALSGKKKTVYIDDYLRIRPVDAIINYNVYADTSKYNAEDSEKMPKLILGASFAPLRGMFQNITPITIRETVKNVLFLAGGSDPEHAALKFVDELKNHEDDFKYNIVIGALSEDYEVIREVADLSGGRINVLKNVTDMAALMLDSDIAISAAGSTLYELCACGVPTINYVLADNQILAAKTFGNKEIMLYGGDLREDADAYNRMYSLIKKLSEDMVLRIKLSSKANIIIDGNGAMRLAKELERFLIAYEKG